MSEAVKDL